MKRGLGLLIALVLFFSLMIPCAPAYAVSESHKNVLAEGNDYTAILYDSLNGLPTSEANAIAQTADGFIWLGGYSGFIRYDGSEFHRFDSSDGISSVFSLFVDDLDRIWIGTNENGIASYDHGKITIYGRVEGLKSNSIRSMTSDKEGNIIVGTTQGLAYVDHADLKLHVIDDPQVNKEYITDLQKDAEGNVYGLTSDGSVFLVEDKSVAVFYPDDKFAGHQINAIYPDPKDASVIYMGTVESEVYTVDASTMTIKKIMDVSPQRNINALIMKDGQLWVAATNGIGYFDKPNHYSELTDIPMTNSVGGMMIDHEDNIWFTSTRQGIMKIVPDRFTDLTEVTGIQTGVVNSTCVNRELLYIGTDRGLKILEIKSLNEKENELTKLLESVRIRCIKNDSNGNIWICTHGDTGFVQYDPSDGEIVLFNEEKGLDTARVRACMELDDKSMAAATGNGLYIIKNGEVTAHYGHENGVNNTEILSIEQGPTGKLYLGSDGDGIYVIDGNKVTRIGVDDGLTSEVVMRIKWDSEREVFWFITSNSIQYMKDGKIRTVTKFPYSNNYDIYFDNSGGAWILSSNGIYITRVDELIANENIEYSFYNTKSGLPYVATGNSRSFLDNDGRLYISGTTGVCLVNINELFGNDELVKLAIPSVTVDGKVMSIEDDGSIFIPAGARRLEINAYALTYGLANPRLSYYLEGFDHDPTLTTKQDLKTIAYTNLNGGRYKFVLNLINDKTGEVEKSVEIAIHKEHSAYENIWFWAIVVGTAIAAVAFGMYRYFKNQTEALEKKQAESQKLIDEIIHTFAKCIDMRDTQNRGHSFRVAIYTKMLATKLAPQRGYTKEQIDEFYNVALLHDIGKLSIPDVILNKPERLNDEEYVVMKSHATKGAEILKDVKIVKDLAYGAGYHHERMDGRGYPNGLEGPEIPEVARIIAVADTFDAMYSTRPYRKILDLNVVLDEMRRIRGTQLDEEVVDALLELAAEGKIDKAKIDAAVEEAPRLASLSDITEGKPIARTDKEKEEEEKRKEALQREREDQDFLNNLGLGKKE